MKKIYIASIYVIGFIFFYIIMQILKFDVIIERMLLEEDSAVNKSNSSIFINLFLLYRIYSEKRRC